jgi:hypothetical protein
MMLKNVKNNMVGYLGWKKTKKKKDFLSIIKQKVSFRDGILT